MYRILFAASEAYPLITTGGLGDVAGALPAALKRLGCDVRLVLPAYRDALAVARRPQRVARLAITPGQLEVDVLETRLPGTGVKVWLIHHPPAYDRPGNPYLDPAGQPWADNAMRFALFARALAALALDRAGLGWRPHVMHAHDWETGLAPALLQHEPQRPATLFTIHNLSYQGLFPYASFVALGLRPALWSAEALEFHGQLSFIKGGLVFADHLTTVSPSYAREIQTPAFGYGLDGLLRHRGQHLTGILNGIDERRWNPATDAHLRKPYGKRRLADKGVSKLALQQECGFEPGADVPVVASIGRLVAQKGTDLVIEAVPALLDLGVQLVVLGRGEASYERALVELAARYRRRVHVHIGYDEPFSHRVEGGADMFLMPSRFEPCGLNQLYSLRYGTVPVVHAVGGLADTVVDAGEAQLAKGSATGFGFSAPTIEAMLGAMDRAIALYRQPARWRHLMLNGMRQSFGWRRSAERYLELYGALNARARDVP